MSSYNLRNLNNLLPYKLKKRIAKTREARSGNEIYKRRNRRNYRVLIQYGTWKKLINGSQSENILSSYGEGFAVLISPKEYFGDNYPNPSSNLDKKFELGKTGFVFYTLLSEYEKYPPLTDWMEVYELNNTGKLVNDDSWVGDYVLNVKNGGYVSVICGKNRSSKEKSELANKLKSIFNVEGKIPEQCGLGNYDYDYADELTMENVQYQMLYLILNSKSRDGFSFPEYIMNNYLDIKTNKDSKVFVNYMENGDLESYVNEFNKEFNLFVNECERRGLLDFDKLQKLGVWSSIEKRAICPLCHKIVYTEEFFDDITQMEGRQVLDNTQKSIVLMHVEALRPGKLNHRPYNLGWGHNYCNLVQGDKDISETIEVLKEIFISYESLK